MDRTARAVHKSPDRLRREAANEAPDDGRRRGWLAGAGRAVWHVKAGGAAARKPRAGRGRGDDLQAAQQGPRSARSR
jgi:hypothetical protein